MENDKYIFLAECYLNIDNSDKALTHFILYTPSKNPFKKQTKKNLKKNTFK